MKDGRLLFARMKGCKKSKKITRKFNSEKPKNHLFAVNLLEAASNIQLLRAV